MKILLATSNNHKRDEIMSVWSAEEDFASLAIELTLLGDLGLDIKEPVEDQATFEGNAILKANYYAAASGLPCIADDSGLEVDALGNEPGVYSARYSGVCGSREVVDPANNKLLMKNLDGIAAEQRSCRFVCAMALCWAEVDRPEPVACLRGEVRGRIITPDQATDLQAPYRGRGDNGFGYDPIFFLPERGKTIAELPPEEKNSISHRGQAARLMYGYLKNLA